MDSALTKLLKAKVDSLKKERVREDAIINSLKEELQYYVLDYIYNSKKYSSFFMYGGSLLRIGYDLSRMSEDLDFQTAEKININNFSNDLAAYFKKRYSFDVAISVPKRTKPETQLIKLRFNILDDFKLKNVSWKVLMLRIDINFFEKADDFVSETIPITKGNLSFNIKTYPLSSLMASKIAAVLTRKTRGIANRTSDCKPRDIYDLMWYIEKKIYPDLEYLKAKGLKFNNILDLYDQIKFRVMNLRDNLFEQDLANFFRDPTEYNDWFVNWRRRFENLINAYKLYKVGKISMAKIIVEFKTDNRYFDYIFKTENKAVSIAFRVKMSDYWFEFAPDEQIKKNRLAEVERVLIKAKHSGEKIEFSEYEYGCLGLFYKKIIDFLARNNNIVTQTEFKTRIIRTNADNLDPKKQVWLDSRLVEKIQFEELL